MMSNIELDTLQKQKVFALEKLALERKKDKLENFLNIGDVLDGYYDHGNYISPWSKSAFNVNTKVMLIAQDWSSEKFLTKKKDEDAATIGHTPSLPTNVNLKKMLRDSFKLEFEDTYATNLFVFIKKGSISNSIPIKAMLYSTKEYAIPQIEIVKPQIVICIGAVTNNIMRRSLNFPPVKIKDSVNNPAYLGNTKIYGVYHTGGLGTANAGGYRHAVQLWHEIAKISNIYSD